MLTVCLFLALAGVIVATVFGLRAQGFATQLHQMQAQLEAAHRELGELRESRDHKAGKDKSRKDELSDLREKVRELKTRVAEAQEQASRARAAEKARRESEEEAHQALSQARAEAAAAANEAKLAKEELALARRGRPAPAPVSPAPKVEDAGKVEAAAVAALERKLEAERARLVEIEAHADSERKKAAEARVEVKRLESRLATSEKVYLVQKSEGELWKDRFRALEGRFNKLMHELDAMRRGVLALERRLPQAKIEEARAEAAAEQKAMEGAPPAASPAEVAPAPAPAPGAQAG
ncbi:MAG: hypothetical protein ACYDCL_21835 [Myxococcales bacterium]